MPVVRARARCAGPGSVDRAGGEHEAGRCPRFRPAANVKRRGAQAAPGRASSAGLGFPTVADDPSRDRLGVSAFGHDRRPFDDRAAGGMRSSQSSDQRPNRVVVHVSHRAGLGHGASTSPKRSASAVSWRWRNLEIVAWSRAWFGLVAVVSGAALRAPARDEPRERPSSRLALASQAKARTGEAQTVPTWMRSAALVCALRRVSSPLGVLSAHAAGQTARRGAT
jgi:hypothetical protein